MMSMGFYRFRIFVALLVAAFDARAETYMAGLDQSQWQVQRSALVCRLMHAVPRFGDAVFETVGGGRQRFILKTKKNPLVGGPTQLTAAAPSWNPAREARVLATVEIGDDTQPLQLDAEPTSQLIDSLRSGLVPMFARPLQNDTSKIVSIALSPINFRPAYREYNACIEQLLPITFDDVKNTAVEFAPEQSDLTAAARKKIDLMLRYMAADRSIKRIEIHGVSSDNKRLLDNFALAQKRVDSVSEYLQSRGIDAKIIAASSRGERATPNNRRRSVSIRLERGSAERY